MYVHGMQCVRVESVEKVKQQNGITSSCEIFIAACERIECFPAVVVLVQAILINCNNELYKKNQIKEYRFKFDNYTQICIIQKQIRELKEQVNYETNEYQSNCMNSTAQ